MVIFAAVLFMSCGEEKPEQDYIARVNDVYLNEEEYLALSGAAGKHRQYKSEAVRNWIDKELLYQEAVRRGLTDTETFNNIIENTKKELAVSLLLSDYYNEEKAEFKEEELIEYFDNNKQLFTRDEDAYLLNTAVFKSEERALQFRTLALESGWKTALSIFKGDSILVRQNVRAFMPESRIHPNSVLRVVRELNSDEISLIIPDEYNRFIVFQYLEKYPKGTIPPFEVIKNEAEKRYAAKRKELLIKAYINELYLDNEIEVKKSGEK